MAKVIKIDQPGDYCYRLETPGEIMEIVGRFQLMDKTQAKVNLTVVHAAVNTKAQISLKAVVADRAKISLNGQVKVESGAVDTDSSLEERVLLLSPQAQAEVVPVLEIINHQVKCNHAAAVGPIDKEQVFYLMCRGITELEAKKLIAKGFLK